MSLTLPMQHSSYWLLARRQRLSKPYRKILLFIQAHLYLVLKPLMNALVKQILSASPELARSVAANTSSYTHSLWHLDMQRLRDILNPARNYCSLPASCKCRATAMSGTRYYGNGGILKHLQPQCTFECENSDDSKCSTCLIKVAYMLFLSHFHSSSNRNRLAPV